MLITSGNQRVKFNMYVCCCRIHEMNLQDENDLDWQVMASNWSRSVFSTFYTL